MPSPSPTLPLHIAPAALDHLRRAHTGDPAALRTAESLVGPAIFTLSLRMLGRRDDARAATTAILTHAIAAVEDASSDIAVVPWLLGIAHAHLRDAPTQALETPAVSFDDIASRRAAGLALYHPVPKRLTTRDEQESLDIAGMCTQGMLMALDREARFAYLIDLLFALSPQQAAAVLDVSAAAYRTQLAAATEALHGFMHAVCGLASADASCRCHRQLPALHAKDAVMDPAGVLLPDPGDAMPSYGALSALFDAAAVMRSVLAVGG